MEFRRRCIDGGDPVVVVIDRVVDDDRRDAAIDEDPIAAVVVDHIVLDGGRAIPNIDAGVVARDLVALYQGSPQPGSDTVAVAAGDGEALDGEVPLPIRLLNPPLIN